MEKASDFVGRLIALSNRTPDSSRDNGILPTRAASVGQKYTYSKEVDQSMREEADSPKLSRFLWPEADVQLPMNVTRDILIVKGMWFQGITDRQFLNETLGFLRQETNESNVKRMWETYKMKAAAYQTLERESGILFNQLRSHEAIQRNLAVFFGQERMVTPLILPTPEAPTETEREYWESIK